ncbi:MAG: HD domain-containing protein [Phycisphaerales bacterium]|nr:HD domain-containing protein [Phycisphaerales bacterium]
MLRVDLGSAVPGMRLAIAIHNPRRPGSVLLRSGFELDATSIAKLKEMGVHDAWIHCPGVEFMAEFVSPAIHRACQELAHSVAGVLSPSAAGADPKLDFSSYKRGVVSLLEKLVEDQTAAIFLGEIGRSGTSSMRHACNVCMISLLVGLKLDYYLMKERPKLTSSEARDVANLGVGALLHDVGMAKLPPEAISRWHDGQDEMHPEFQDHVSIGHKLVHDSVDPSAAIVVLHHHQRFDGGGFPFAQHLTTPRPLAGAEIHIFARIAAAADMLDRLRYNVEVGGSPDTPPVRPMVRALRMLTEHPYASRLDPVVLRTLLTVVPPYAPGTRITLSDGSEGVVVGWNPADPCRPTVAELIVPRKTHTPLPQATSVQVDLSRNADLQIVRAEGCDVAADNYTLPADSTGYTTDAPQGEPSPARAPAVKA